MPVGFEESFISTNTARWSACAGARPLQRMSATSPEISTSNPKRCAASGSPCHTFDPRQQDVEYRFSAEKVSFDLATYVYYQTYLNTPVWAAGVTVALKQRTARVVAATDTTQQGIDAKLPSSEALERYRRLFAARAKRLTVPRRGAKPVGPGNPTSPSPIC